MIQVFNSEESKIFATILAISHQDPQAHDQTYVGFEERRADRPGAIHEWFYPGNDRSLEFVHPKPRAEEEAGASETPAELEQKSVVTITPDIRKVQIAERFDDALAAPAQAIAHTGAAAESRRELPSTASPIAMLLPLGSPSFVLAPAVGAMARDN